MPVRLKKCSGPCAAEKPAGEFWADSKQTDGKMTRCIECVREARRDRSERRARGEVVPAVTEEERKRRSQLARRLHEQGRFGGPEFGAMGGRPRKPSVNEHLIEHFRERSDLIVRAVESNLRSKNKAHRMRAAEFVSKLELEHDKAQREARGQGKTPEEMTKEELQEFVAAALTARIEAGELDVKGFIDLDPSQVQEISR